MVPRLRVFQLSLYVMFLLGFLNLYAHADTINFESFSGPSLFASAGNAQTLNISTSIGTVQVSGGVILTNATNLPADETSIYGTAGNAGNIGVTVGSGFTNPLILTFPTDIHNFFLDVLNGNIQDVTYMLSDNLGNSGTFTLSPNLSGGQKTIGFSAAGNVITVEALTGQSTPNGITWDFFVDNVHFNEPLPGSVPEPSSIFLLLAGLGFVNRKYRSRTH